MALPLSPSHQSSFIEDFGTWLRSRDFQISCHSYRQHSHLVSNPSSFNFTSLTYKTWTSILHEQPILNLILTKNSFISEAGNQYKNNLCPQLLSGPAFTRRAPLSSSVPQAPLRLIVSLPSLTTSLFPTISSNGSAFQVLTSAKRRIGLFCPYP